MENPTAVRSEEIVPDETVPIPRFDRADTLPEIETEHAQGLFKLQVSDGDFETDAVVNDDGRLDINIQQSSKHLAGQIVSTLQTHLQSDNSCTSGICDNLPPPRMNIVIHVVGSRGDVQPFVSLGKVLKSKYGHRIRLATHPTFKTFVEENGLEFFSIGGDPAELMAFMVKNPGLMPGLDSLRSGDVGQRRKEMYRIVKGCWRSCIEAGNGLDDVDYAQLTDSKPFIADAIIANPPSFAHVHCAERLGIPLHLMFTMPWSPTQSFPHPLTTIHSSNSDPNLSNLVSYALVEMMTWQGLGDIMNRFRTKILGLEPISLMWAPGMISRLRIPFTYCWSPALIPKPEDWGAHINISGFFFLSLASSFTPDPELVAFLEAGPPPVYIGFGSIVVADPDAMTALIFAAVKKAGIRALVSKGWGGFGGDVIPENVYMLGNVPHDYLFKHVSAVVHHGGAGTTAAGILAGKPTVVVPFFGDQPFWGAMTARAGAGPSPVPFKHLTADILAAAILEALTPEAMEKAKILGERISKEEGAKNGAESFHSMLDMPKQRCVLAPNRVAVCRIKRTHIRLSAAAAIVLGDEGLVKSSELKLYRPYEYNTEDGPWDPITGGASALLGTLSSLMVGIADLPVTAVTSLRASVKKSALERAERARDSASAASLALSPSSTISKASGKESLDMDPIPSPEDHANSIRESIDSSRVSHTFTIASSVKVPAHSHRFDTSSNHSHKAAVAAEKGATIAAMTVLRPVMDFTVSLAKGFHNAPKLYGDEVRGMEKVDGFRTGVAAGARGFAYGWYDGFSGLVTQPYKGAKKHGATGFLQGIAKGVGGLILKPGSALFGLPAQTFSGIYRTLQTHMGATVHSYIIAARITQGHEEYEELSASDKASIIERYHQVRQDPAMKKAPKCPSKAVIESMHRRNQSELSVTSQDSNLTGGRESLSQPRVSEDSLVEAEKKRRSFHFPHRPKKDRDFKSKTLSEEKTGGKIDVKVVDSSD